MLEKAQKYLFSGGDVLKERYGKGYCIVNLFVTYCQQTYVDRHCCMEKQFGVLKALAGVYFGQWHLGRPCKDLA